MIVQAWGEIILQSLQDLWIQFVGVVPAIVGAIVVFVIGWIIAMAFDKVVTRVLQTLQIDKFLDQIGVMKSVHNVGIKWEFSEFVGWLVKWFFMIAFFLAAVDIIGLTGVADFIKSVLLYIPNVIVAALILIVAALVADFLDKVVHTSLKATSFSTSRMASIMVRWAVWIFAILAAINQLGIATSLVNTLFMGIVAMFALAGGLAFGLGGQGFAKDLLEEFRKDLKMK